MAQNKCIIIIIKITGRPNTTLTVNADRTSTTMNYSSNSVYQTLPSTAASVHVKHHI